MDVTLILMKLQLRGDLKRTPEAPSRWIFWTIYDISNKEVKFCFEAVTLKIEFSVHI